MAGFKDFTDGQYFTAAEVDGYLMRQSVMRFTTTANILSNLPTGIREHGMMAWADSTNTMYVYSSALTAWIPWDSAATTFTGQGVSGASNWTNSNAQQFGQWRYAGGMVQWNWRYIVGSTSNLQAGNYSINLPIATHTNLNDGYTVGSWTFRDATGPAYYGRYAVTVGSSSTIGAITEAGVRMATTTPAAPGTGDIFTINAHYLPTESVWLT